MLVLTRRAGDSLLIGDDIELTVVEIQGDRVRIGIKAPKSVSILRAELAEEAAEANREAAGNAPDLSLLAEAVRK